MATVELTADNFESTVLDNDIVLVDFWASWCGPCRTFAPIFEAASEKHPDLVFGKIDTENEQMLASSFNIQAIPTLMIFREKVLLFAEPGAMPAGALSDVIDQVLALDMDEVRASIAAQSHDHAHDHAHDHDHDHDHDH